MSASSSSREQGGIDQMDMTGRLRDLLIDVAYPATKDELVAAAW